MAQAFLSKNNHDFSREAKTLKPSKKMILDNIDGIHGNKNILEHLASKYDSLYNSLPYDPNTMVQIKVALARREYEDQEVNVEVTSEDVKRPLHN